MAVTCAAASCKADCTKEEYAGLAFFPFPIDETICKSWIERCARYDLLNKTISDLNLSERLCQLHFEDHCYDNTEMGFVLKQSARPSLFNHDMTQFSSQIDEERRISVHPHVATVHYGSLEDGVNVITFQVEMDKRGETESGIPVIKSGIRTLGNNVYLEPGLLIRKDQVMHLDRQVVNCFKTMQGSGEMMEPYNIVVEEVQTMQVLNEWAADVEQPATSKTVHMIDLPVCTTEDHDDGGNLPRIEGVGTGMRPADMSMHVMEFPVCRMDLMCRVCAEECHNLVPVFGEQGVAMDLPKKITWYLPIQVKQEDQLPLKLCSLCIAKLNSCHELVNMCVAADAKLRRLFCAEPSILRKPLLRPTDEMSVQTESRGDSTCDLDSDVNEQRIPTKDEPDDVAMEEENTFKQNLEKKLKQMTKHDVLKAMDLLKAARREDESDDELNEECERCDAPCDTTISNEETETDDNNEKLDNQMISLSDACNKTIDFKNGQIYEVRKVVDVYVESADETLDPSKRTTTKFRMEVCSDMKRTGAELKSKIDSAQDMIQTTKEEVEVCVNEDNIEEQLYDDNEEEKSVIKCVLNNKRKCPHKTSWQCKKCGHMTRRKGSLIMHQRQKHKPDEFACCYCDKQFHNAIALSAHKLSLDIHMATHSKETPFLCDLCGKSFKHLTNLRSHKRSHLDSSRKNRQVCDLCGKGFRSRFHLSEHMNIHNGLRPYPCPVCSKSFAKKIQLRQHSSAHLGTQPFKCPTCGVAFNRRGNMTQHLKRHEQERKYVCRVCLMEFISLGAVLAHRKKHTQEEVEQSLRQKVGDDLEEHAFKCKVCGKFLAKKDTLEIHMRSHSGEKLFGCSVCGKRLSNKGSLNYHMRAFHTGERPHSCQYCGEGFLSREACMVHERIHTGEKPFKCEMCTMAFRCTSNLTQHMRVHSTERPYVCRTCGKRFPRKGTLDVHMRTHTGERPFSCNICGRGFTQKNDMLKHKRTHVGGAEWPWPCAVCGEQLMSRTQLLEHEAVQHMMVHGRPIIPELIHVEVPVAGVPDPVAEASVEGPELVVEDPLTQTIVISTADNLIDNFSHIETVTAADNTQTLILQSF
uniref:Zinc finger protein n=1 Tax=Timema poppense TaxID=170557 RepID=A0A7R9CI24_TIMPO|nr:unnamed protein product [Timema poppensis]